MTELVQKGTLPTLEQLDDAGKAVVVNQTGNNYTLGEQSGASVAFRKALRLPGYDGIQGVDAAFNWVSTPDAPSLAVTDIDIRVKVAFFGDRPKGNIVSKTSGDAGGAIEFYFYNYDELLEIEFDWYSDDNDADLSSWNGIYLAVPSLDVLRKWLRVTLDVDDGNGGSEGRFYTSEDYDPLTGTGTWDILESDDPNSDMTNQWGTTPGVTRIGTSAAPLQLFGHLDGTGKWGGQGDLFYFEMRDGIDGPVVASFNPALVDPTGPRLPTEVTQGDTIWTIHGATWEWVDAPDRALAYQFMPIRPSQVVIEGRNRNPSERHFFAIMLGPDGRASIAARVQPDSMLRVGQAGLPFQFDSASAVTGIYVGPVNGPGAGSVVGLTADPYSSGVIGALPGVTGIYTHVNIAGATAVAARGMGLQVETPRVDAGSTCADMFGIYVSAQKVPPGVTRGWGIFQAGADDVNVFAGSIRIRKTAAPADGDLIAGEAAVWFDQSNGAAKLMVKAKQADGTVKAGSLALT